MFRKASKISSVGASTASTTRPMMTWQRLGFWYLLGKYSKDYGRETSLNCLKYVADDRLSRPTRFYFACLFVIVVGVAFNFATNVFIKWNTTPVLIGKDSYESDITAEPFPAITICNMNVAMKSAVQNIREGTLSWAMLQNVCHRNINFTAYAHLQYNNSIRYNDFLVRVAQPCQNMFVDCKFGGKDLPCLSLFREILLDDGVCCVFNIAHPQFLYNRTHTFINDYASYDGRIPVDWNPETGYPPSLPQNFYPRKGVGPGKSYGMSVVLNAEMDEYYCSSTNGQGFKVMLHNPIDTPNIKETGLALRIGYETTFRVMTNSFIAQPSIRSIGALRRLCYFQGEYKLTYYKYYSRRNCEHECDGHFVARRCNCLPHYLTSLYTNVSACSVSNFDCVKAAIDRDTDAATMACKAKCLPSCHNIFYYPSPFSGPFAKRDYMVRNKFIADSKKDFAIRNYALLHVYHRDSSYTKLIRTPYMALTDYLSQTGAIMSLMVGFGVLSIAEFIYFWFIRPVFDYRLKRPPFGWVMSSKATKRLQLKRGKVLILREGRHLRRPPIHKDNLQNYQEYLDNYGYLE